MELLNKKQVEEYVDKLVKNKVENSNLEKKYRINIKQSAKGQAYFEITIRADTKEEAKKLLDEATELALIKCQQLNSSEPTQD